MNYYGHTKEDPVTKEVLPKQQWQLLSDHLQAVAVLTEERAAKFGAGKIGKIIGLSHDLGKYSRQFQRRLENTPGKVDHATAGAQVVYQKFGPVIGRVLAFTIAGHHGGLPDGTRGDRKNLPGRLDKNDLPDFQAYRQEIEIPDLVRQDLAYLPVAKCAAMKEFSRSFFIRLLYSCLVDADYLDTERYMDSGRFAVRAAGMPIAVCWERLQPKLAELKNRGVKNPSVINQARRTILEQCLAKAEHKPGLFTLTVPTGGGKTYASLAFGLKHAVQYNKGRLIYVIPYTSIIEQNAAVFREALEQTSEDESVVLEHHSNFEYPEKDFADWDPREKVHRLAAENWDMPVVVTTAVQFFESLYANKGGRCRKLHNLANSVIILDEAQMMPIDYLRPCLWALAELVLNYGATVVLCTATQPAVIPLLPDGLQPTEIMENPQQLQQLFKRVSIHYAGNMSDVELAEAMAGENQVLTIVNTRRHARLLFEQLQAKVQVGNYHLSARMCPAHRKLVLVEIRQALEAGQPCRVVSTQLIEAGVDVDFPAVYRSAAGLDSIAQAAGRCNREGRRASGRVVVFEPEAHGMPSKGRFSAVAGITRSVLRQIDRFDGELLSLEAIEFYFHHLFDMEKNNLDAQNILAAIHEGQEDLAFPFAKIAEKFQLIDSETVPVVVPWPGMDELMNELQYHPFPESKARLLQPYVVQIYQYELAALEKEKAVQTVGELFKFVIDGEFYDRQFGLKDAKEVNAPSEVMIY